MANWLEVLSQFKAPSKRNKNALIMSSSHFSISISIMDCHKKFTVITDYDKHKGGVTPLIKIVKNSVG